MKATFAVVVLVGLLMSSPIHGADEIQKWLGPQNWERDVDGPVVELGTAGEFDDTHIFAPCVAEIDRKFLMWYSGSTGRVAERVFSLGLATSDDGRRFQKHAPNPVYAFGDGRRSVLTAALLRSDNGACLRESGKLRMWFSAANLTETNAPHALYEAGSVDGIAWSAPSGPQLEGVYAPTVVKDGDRYLLWYTDVTSDPWVIRHAVSADGRAWNVHPDPVVTLDQPWEEKNLFYPYVMKTDGVYLLWYGSYWIEHPSRTALGFAVSTDGIEWHKHPQNPVFRPDPTRAWESHYTTSQSVVRGADGSFRIWYASRKAPPFVNKYFAIGTARWTGPQ